MPVCTAQWRHIPSGNLRSTTRGLLRLSSPTRPPFLTKPGLLQFQRHPKLVYSRDTSATSRLSKDPYGQQSGMMAAMSPAQPIPCQSMSPTQFGTNPVTGCTPQSGVQSPINQGAAWQHVSCRDMSSGMWPCALFTLMVL